MTVRLLLADPSSGRICTTCDNCVVRSVGELYYHNLKQHHYDFIVKRDRITDYYSPYDIRRHLR
jgi:hypothetical protein